MGLKQYYRKRKDDMVSSRKNGVKRRRWWSSMEVEKEKMVEEQNRRRRGSDIPEGGGGGGSRGKPKRERGERSRLEKRLRALRHCSHLPTSATRSAQRDFCLSCRRHLSNL